MKILLVTMEFPPSKGGVENYYFNLAKNLSDDEIVVLTDRKSRIPRLRSGQVANREPETKIYTFQFFYRIFWPRWFKLFFKVRKIIKKEKIDLIWCGQVLPVGTVCYLISKLYKIPYFVSTHGLDILLPQKSARKKKLMSQILRSAKFVTANSQFTQGQLLKLGISEQKIGVIFPCANVSGSFSPTTGKIAQIRQKLGLEQKIILLSVGRLVKRKGCDKVIEAVAQLSPEYPDLTYLIVGEGPEKESLKSQVSSLKLDGQVKIFDDVDDDKLKFYYQIADIFIMPARDIKGDVEGFGIVYLEAASFKLPVIAGKSGGVNEAVIDGQTGILVNPENVEEIKKAIVKLIKNKDLRLKLGENGYIRSQKEFDWKVQATQLKNLITRTITDEHGQSQTLHKLIL